MDNDKLFLDSVDVSDAGPKGYVILTDKNTGKVIFQKHNMVVKSGKKYIFSLFARANSNNDQSEIAIISKSNTTVYTDNEGYGDDKVRLSYLEFGIGSNDVSANDTGITPVIDTSNNSTYHPLRFFIYPSNSTATGTHVIKSIIDKSDEKFYIKFEFNFDGNILENIGDASKHLISELGLFLLNPETKSQEEMENDSDGVLFSRIRFDTIPITSESSFLLQYYVYF